MHVNDRNQLQKAMTKGTSDSLDLSTCAHANLRKAMRAVSQRYDALLKPAGLRATQFTLLAVLERHDELPLTKLADILVMDRTTLTRNLKPLAAQGWLEIGRDRDERVRLVAITDGGRQVLADAIPLWQVAQGRIIDGIGKERLDGMVEDLNRLVEAIHD